MLLIIVCNNSLAQPTNLVFEHYAHEDGLAGDRVLNIYKDLYGFMWFGTTNGLSRFDGGVFRNYKNVLTDSSSISNNTINAITEDLMGNLWVGTDRGLNKYDRELESFTRYHPDPNRENWLSHNYITDLTTDQNGIIWITTYGGGLNRFDPENELFINFRFNKGDPGSILQDYQGSVLVDGDGIVWIGLAGYGLDRFDPKTETFIHHKYDRGNPDVDFRNNVIRDITEKGDSLLLSTYGGLNILDKNSGEFISHFGADEKTGWTNSSVHNAQEDSNGNIWVATSIGLHYLNTRNGEITVWRKNQGQIGALQDELISDIFYDPSGSIWLATLENGVHRGHLGTKEFLLKEITTSNHLFANAFSGFAQTDISGKVYLASGHGIIAYLPGVDKFELIDEFKFPEVFYHDVVVDKRGRIWAATEGNGVYQYDTETDEFLHLTYSKDDSTSLGFNIVFDIMEDHAGNIWMATSGGGLNKFLPDSKTFSKFVFDEDDSSSISSSAVIKIYQDRDLNYWVGTSSGLNKFDPGTGKFYRLISEVNPAGSVMGGNHVFDIHQDGSGFIWAGTRVGLERYDHDGKKIKIYTEDDGLPSNEIWSIIGDDLNNIWVGTGNGLAKFNLSTNNIRAYDNSDGIPFNRFALQGAMKLNDGSILMGSRTGLLVFHPENITDNLTPPRIVITDFSVHEPDQKSIRRNFYHKITLNHLESVFDISYAALSYTASVKNQFAYMMEGFDKDWVMAGNRKFVTYTNLNPGIYTFRVKGSNNDGIWNEEGAFVDIEVLPPPWKTWWAYSLYTLAIFSLIWGFVRYQIKEAKLKSNLQLEQIELEKMKEISAVKSRFVANISHEFRTPLTLILGPLKGLISGDKSVTGDAKLYSMMYKNGMKLLDLINKLLDLSKLENATMVLKVTENDIGQFIKIIFANFTSLAESKKVGYNLAIPDKPISLHFDPEAMEEIMNNLIANAIKFTPSGGQVNVILRETSDSVLLDVMDTGIGIENKHTSKIFDRFYQVDDPRAGKHSGTGIGLSLVSELLELHHGAISVSSEINKGSTFTAKLLKGNSHFTLDQIKPGKVEKDLEHDQITLKPPQNEIGDNNIDEDSSIVLIIEDSDDMRLYVKDILEKNYRILEAENGAEGFKLAAEYIPDLVITDVMMPEMDGLEFCQKLKSDERTSHIPVIMLTAKAEDKNKLEGLETGADAYLTKPFNVEELEIRMQKLIELRHKLIAKFSKIISVAPGDINTHNADERFLQSALGIIEHNISNSDFDVEKFSKEMGLSRVQLYRKIKALTNLTITELIRKIRIKRAAQLLENNKGDIAGIAYEVGFNNLSYFSKCFKEEFHCTPSDYIHKSSSQG